MKKQLKIFTLYFSFLIATLLLPNILLWSCGPNLEADESRFALFQTGIDGQNGLTPFYYTQNIYNISDGYFNSTDRFVNCKEWVSFSNNEVEEKDVFSVQYDSVGQYFLDDYTANNYSHFKKNSFIKWLVKPKNKAVLDYMVAAKQNEALQLRNEDPWDTSNTKSLIAETIVKKAMQNINSVPSEFLKQRYAFQAIKSLHYNEGESEEFSDSALCKFYTSQLDNKKTIVAAWSKVYYAMAQNNANERTLYLLKAFDEAEEKKLFCFQNVHLKDLNKLEKTNVDVHTYALINAMRALKNPGRAIAQIQAVVKFEPDSKYLPTLLTREINKLEYWLWSPEMLLFPDNDRGDVPDESMRNNNKLRQQDEAYLVQLRLYLEELQNTTEGKKAYLKLALIHLYNMEHNTIKAKQHLNKLPVFKNNLCETQRLIEKVITMALSRNITTPIAKSEIAYCVAKLKALNPAFEKQLNNTDEWWNWQGKGKKNDECLSELYVLLGKAFKQQGDILTAGLLNTKANVTINEYGNGGWQRADSTFNYRQIAYYDHYASAKDVQHLLQFKHQKFKTKFQQLLVPAVWAKDDFYKDLEGTILFRQKKYHEALAVFNSMNASFWQNNYEYSNYLAKSSVTHTGKFIPSEKSIAAKYPVVSKKFIVDEFIKTQQAIQSAKTDSVKAMYYYALANAYFNTSYNGKDWMMFSYGKSSYEDYFEDKKSNYNWANYYFKANNPNYRDDYYACKTAIENYKKAYKLTQNKELAAKCLIALAACDKIAHSCKQEQGSKWGNNNYYTSSYLNVLSKNYAFTAAYKEAAIKCPDVLVNNPKNN